MSDTVSIFFLVEQTCMQREWICRYREYCIYTTW